MLQVHVELGRKNSHGQANSQHGKKFLVRCREVRHIALLTGDKNSHIGFEMTTALPHIHRIGVLPADIDFMGHVNNARYLNWVQDAVLAHWNKLAPPETATKYLWVALKHEITYRKPAFLDDDVIATVVLEKVQGARSFYDTVIKRGEEVLAEVKSSWCCIDAETLRPARIAAEIQEYFFPKD